jgi:hypothetical protein
MPTPPAAAVNPLLVTTEGVGYLRVGAPVPQDEAEPIVVFDPDACVGGSSAGADGAWIATADGMDYGDLYVITKPRTRDGDISALYVFNAEFTTAEGIHPGSTFAELTAAYAQFDEVVTGDGSDLYVIDGQSGQLVFEIANRGDIRGPAPDAFTSVVWMSVHPFGAPLTPIAFTDGNDQCGA